MSGMLPILFESTERNFTTQGIGVLSEALSCDVTEERNGIFELEMQYPITGVHFKEVKNRRILYTIPSPYRLPQPFRIYRITKPLNGICTIYAQHITYDLSGVPLSPFSASSAPQAMLGLQTNAAIQNDFKFWTDKSVTGNFSVIQPTSTRGVLGGNQGSILDVFGGEYEWDKFTVKLHTQRGQDNGITIRYGKNLTDIEQDENISNLYTGIYPFWMDTEGNKLVVCNPKVVPAHGTYNFQKVLPVDFSQNFQEQPTPEQLKTQAEAYIKNNKVGIPAVSITANFVQLEQTEDFDHLALLEKCDLCDIVTVQFEQLGIDVKAKIVKIQTDCLTGRYKQVEIGETKTNIADTIAGQGQAIQERPTNHTVSNIANQIASTILGAKGGTVRFLDENGDGEPDTLYIADHSDPQKAKKVWRFNYEGWGASSTGYNGPYHVAASIDDGFYADFIKAGTLDCATLKVINLIADHVKSKSGNYLMELWAAIFKLMDKEKLRVRIYTTAVEDSVGAVQVFRGDVTKNGEMQEGSLVTQVLPWTIEVGKDKDGNFDGHIITKNVFAKESVQCKNCNLSAINTNPISWKWSNEVQAWVLTTTVSRNSDPTAFSIQELTKNEYSSRKYKV